MLTWTFEAGGQAVTLEAADKRTAMGEANARLGAGTSRLPQGAWMEASAPRTFYWAAGNFFD